MKFAVWFAHGYSNAELLSEHNDFTSAVTAANRAASTGSEDIEVLNALGQKLYSIGFSQLNEFVGME